MSHFKDHPEIFNQLIRLGDEDPETVIKNFFIAYKLCEIRQHLWDLVEVAITTDNDVFEDSRNRNNIVWFYRQLEEALEAVLKLKVN